MNTDQKKYWIGVVSKEHVERAVKLGITQIGHGKKSGLLRLSAGDGFIYYSPKIETTGNVALQAFTAIGFVTDDDIWQVGDGEFKPWRRRIKYLKSIDASIRPLLNKLNLTTGKENWGIVFRYGLVEISMEDFEVISTAMRAK